MYPLIRFLRIKPYNDWNNYRNTFSVPLKKPQQEGRSIVKFRALLKAILLRRLKTSLIDGQPILILPPKTVEIIHPVFSEDEQNFYSALEAKTAIQFNKYLRANAIGRNYSNILLLLLRLRQACCHPHLIKDIEEPGTGDAATDGVDLALELPAQTVERIQDSGIEECPVCMDMSNNPSIVIPCGHAFCKDCIVRIHALASSRAIHYGNEGESAVCPTCRGPLAVGKVIAWTTFQKVFGPQDQGVADVVGLQPDKGKGPARLDAQAMNKLRRNAFSSEDNMNQYIAELERDWMSSAKIDKCMEVLEAISQRDTTEKTIIFSQWTSLLQLLEVPIHRKGWKYRRYDGSMDSRARNDAVIQFTDDPNIKIMLISLKAGNSGLNLVAASQVIILDPFYNPYVEEQAIDRAHRIGQVRPLTVHRLTVERTVEERVLTIQQEKKDLIEGALDETEAKGIGRLGERDLAFLFVSLILPFPYICMTEANIS